MSRFERMIDRLMQALDYFVTFLMAALLIEVLLIILARQIGESWVWLYDVARWTMAWLVFIAAVPLARRGAHLAIEVAANVLPAWAKAVSEVLIALATIAVGSLIAYYGAVESLRMYESGERSMSGTLPAVIGYAVLPVGFALLVLVSLVRPRPQSSEQNLTSGGA